LKRKDGKKEFERRDSHHDDGSGGDGRRGGDGVENSRLTVPQNI